MPTNDNDVQLILAALTRIEQQLKDAREAIQDVETSQRASQKRERRTPKIARRRPAPTKEAA